MTTTATIPNTSTQFSPSSGRAYASLVLGLLGLLVCIVLSPLAWYLGWAERRDIRAGLAPASGDDIATIGMVLGIIGTALLGLAVFVVLAIVVIGLAVLAVVT